MKSLVIISGRSGSGKSTALHVLEDMGYYCIDNLPVSLVEALVQRLQQTESLSRVAVSIDARNIADELANFAETVEKLKDVPLQIVYLDAASPSLVKRFSETRRKHPLTNNDRDLKAALELETQLLDNI
ncbi:MAG: RNase adapter RapZ, partial [Pseudomonadales bacterium]